MYVKAKKKFKYRSKELKDGDIIEVSTDLANRLAQRGFVVKATEQEYMEFSEKAKDNKIEDLTKLKVEQLKEIAKELEIKNYSSLNKNELIEAIKNAKEL